MPAAHCCGARLSCYYYYDDDDYGGDGGEQQLLPPFSLPEREKRKSITNIIDSLGELVSWSWCNTTTCVCVYNNIVRFLFYFLSRGGHAQDSGGVHKASPRV